MLAFGYAGETGLLDAWVGFFFGMAGRWIQDGISNEAKPVRTKRTKVGPAIEPGQSRQRDEQIRNVALNFGTPKSTDLGGGLEHSNNLPVLNETELLATFT